MYGKYIKVLLCASCVAILGLLACLGVSAEATEVGGGLTASNLLTFGQATEAQAEVTRYMVNTPYPFMITASGDADQWTYKVYTAYTEGTYPSSGYGVGAVVTLSPAQTFLYSYDYSITSGLNTQTYVYTLNSQFTLGANEQIVAYKVPLGGWVTNPNATGGRVLPNTIQQTPWNVWKNWLNAEDAVAGTLSWDGVMEDTANARQQGYNQGLEEGKTIGRDEVREQYEINLRLAIAQAKQEGRDEAYETIENGGRPMYFLDISSIIGAYVDAVIEFAESITAYDLFGVNIGAVFGAIVGVLVLALVVGVLVKLLGLLL